MALWLLQYARRKSHCYFDDRTFKILNRYGVDKVNYLNNKKKKDQAWKLCLK